MSKIIIFGTGLFWENRKKYIIGNSDIVCFIDNSKEKKNTYIDGIKVCSPEMICEYEYDYILIMSSYFKEMKEQLIGLGVENAKILDLDMYFKEELKEVCMFYSNKKHFSYENIDVVIISTSLNYNGGTMAAIYAAKALQLAGKRILLCSEAYDTKLLNEILSYDIDVVIAPAIPEYINKKMWDIINNSKMVLVNVFQMVPAICSLNGKVPVLWWIHEPKELYEPTLNKYLKYSNADNFSKINTIAVSRIAMNNFNEIFPDTIKEYLPYSIPDTYVENKVYKHNKITFAVLGAVIVRKAQDIFIEAVKMLEPEYREQAEFLIIGSDNNDFAVNLKSISKDIPEIIFTGNLTRKEVDEIYNKIDVVVCPSREETMSIVLTEAMMYKKPCISAENVGMADYIEDGKNGFICKTEDAHDLCGKMRYFIVNRDKIEAMGNEGRKVYENYFTLEKFAQRLTQEVDRTIEEFNN